jgi:hypothetical protein
MPRAYCPFQTNTRISGLAKSRAAGVTIVFGPIKILRFSRMALRTSASQTKSTGFGAGSGWDGGAASAGSQL